MLISVEEIYQNYVIETVSGHVLFMTFSLRETTEYNEMTRTQHTEDRYTIIKITFLDKEDGLISLEILY